MMSEKPFVLVCFDKKDIKCAETVRGALADNDIDCRLLSAESEASDEDGADISGVIRDCTVFILLNSKATRRSQYVRGSLEAAYKSNKQIISFDLRKGVREYDFLLAKSDRIAAYTDKEYAYTKLILLCRDALGMPLDEPVIPDFSKEKKAQQKRRRLIRLIPVFVLAAALLVLAVFLIYRSSISIKGDYGDGSWSFDPTKATLIIREAGNTDSFANATDYPWYDHSGEITTVIVKDGSRRLGDNSFAGYEALKKVELPDSLEQIGKGAFSGCTALESVRIPQKIVSIEDDTFKDCSSLTSVELPDDLTQIGDRSFSACTSLRAVALPDGLEKIGKEAFCGCTELLRMELPDTVTSIRAKAFCDCSRLKTVNIPASVTKIGNYALGFHTGDDGVKYVTEAFVLIVEKDSAGEQYAVKNKVGYKYR